MVHLIPERARERILDLAATQLPDGGAYHQYQPLTKTGNDKIGSNFNDDPLWLVLSVAAYIKETGDLNILNEEVVYENTPNSEKPLLDHIERGLKYISERLGPHKLPLIGRADWNDCLNLNTFAIALVTPLNRPASTSGFCANTGLIVAIINSANSRIVLFIFGKHPFLLF